MGQEKSRKYDLSGWLKPLPVGISREYRSVDSCYLCGVRVRKCGSHGCKWCGSKYCDLCILKTDVDKCPWCKALGM